MKESDLFEPLKQFLSNEMNCEKVFAEVVDLDVVGKHGNVYIGIEMKTSLNFKVIEQAERRKHLVDYMFILVPKPKHYHAQLILDWLKHLEIGLIYFDEKAYRNKVSIYFWGKRQRSAKRFKIADYINEKLDVLNVGGVKGGESITPYKNTIDKIKHALYMNKDGLTIEEVLLKVQTHYAAPKPSVVATLQAHWNQQWCEVFVKDNERYFKMKEDYREEYWNEYIGLSREVRALRKA